MADWTDTINMVQELLQAEAGLSGWEMDFIEDMDGRTTFSVKQAAKIEEVWQRCLGWR
jgi:hypothetical protein